MDNIKQDPEFAILYQYVNMIDQEIDELKKKPRSRGSLEVVIKSLMDHKDNIMLVTEDARQEFKRVIMQIDKEIGMMDELKNLMLNYGNSGNLNASQVEEENLGTENMKKDQEEGFSNYLRTKELQCSTSIKGLDIVLDKLEYAVKNEKKRSLLDWLKEVDGSESDCGESLKKIKIQAFHAGISICTMLVNLRLFTSRNIDIESKFKLVRDSMKWVIADDSNSFVIRKTVDLLDSTDSEIRHILKGMGAVVIQDPERNPEAIELVKEEYVDDLILQLLEGINRLEVDLILPLLPASEMLIQRVLLTTKRYVDICEKDLKEVERKIIVLRHNFAKRYGDEILKYALFSNEYRLVQSKIKEAWKLTGG
ncbi:conserved hypothetical protein [Ricinus communis]|uniref:Uncharacterized protein n=1 Tax=Ricinus communis TaxID=3988 RepID=B9S147_RICCO|nr:conserved hypothetical protein [Ricinus communis]